jgi:hypothetical protein
VGRNFVNSIPVIPFIAQPTHHPVVILVLLTTTDRRRLTGHMALRHPSKSPVARLQFEDTSAYTLARSQRARKHVSPPHNFRVQVLVARGRSEWFVRVVVSAAVLVGLTPTVIVAAPAPTWPSIPMTIQAEVSTMEFSKRPTEFSPVSSG